MRGIQAYQQQQTTSQPRIDIILALYRKALEQLRNARVALLGNNADAARPHLTRAHLIVQALASGMCADDELAVNFLRLYEFVSDRLTRGTVEDIDAAHNVLQTLLEGFEAARQDAVALESSGVLPVFGQQHTLQVTT